MNQRREDFDDEVGPVARDLAATGPPSQAGAAARRRRIRRALSSAPQLRDMVIVQELLEPPLGIRGRP